MKLLTKLSLGILCCGSLVASGPASTVAPLAPAAPAQETTIPERGTGARTVQYGDKDVIAINSRLRFTTLIVLPKNEHILDFVCGDKDFWVVNGTENFAYVKPAKANTRSNLNLITASGNVYSFLLQEVTNTDPDLKVFVELRDASMLSAVSAAPKFVSAQTVDDYRQQVEMAKAETRQVHATAVETVDKSINKYREDYPTKALQFPYRFESRKTPFYVSAIFHDDKFTYIQASPQETPALYELKDGKPNLIDFQFKNGTYIVPKILDSGYLTIGKAKLPFSKSSEEQ